MGSQGYERRLGARHPVAWVEVGWYYRLPSTGPGDPGGIQAEMGFLVDISVSGAGIVADANPLIAIGSVVGVAYRDMQGTVTVRRIEPVRSEPDRRLYGIEFTEANSPLVVGLSEVFVARHSQLPKWRDPRYADDHPSAQAPPEQGFAAPIDASSLGGDW